ncbi:AbrB/MazE/SpoVT family DNA-binding domain-containing protein [Phyllobacterium leguminum]|uniref:AbrB family transcriptional regulator n=1 Tax=Phyllobacterium leguminum TaxID=314237 RepID=A0A318T5N8_9HYPH|nr:AbrB/MazE/SpoVT family DNA-binding domain-containing protein [Phyllobacterium leguminum]PYE89547.1 AbrB family transcriptional regulator [Phyllobacterium leguminum]
MTTKVSAKGQITLPKGVRDFLGLTPGTELVFSLNSDRQVVLVRADGKKIPSRIEKALGHAGPGPTTDEIMELMRGGS